jgi:hypothetical protein
LAARLPALDKMLLAARLAGMYATFFPQHPEWLEQEIGDGVDEEKMARAVCHFLRQMGERFPLHDELWDEDWETLAWRLEEIPIIPMGLDIWYEGWDELAEPCGYLLHQMDWWVGAAADESQLLYPAHPLPADLRPLALAPSLREMGLLPPLDGLPDLIEMLEQASGNFWLDMGEMAFMEGGGYPAWEEETVELLTAEWALAEPILRRVQALLDWQNETAEERAQKVTAVWQALLAAYERKGPKEQADE